MLDPHLSCVQNVGPYPCSVGLFAYVCWQTPACFASCVDVTAEVQNLRHSPHPALRAGKMQMRSISFFASKGELKSHHRGTRGNQPTVAVGVAVWRPKMNWPLFAANHPVFEPLHEPVKQFDDPGMLRQDRA